MFRNARDLEGFEVRARDGRIGQVSDTVFDDRRWTIRYLVVDAGSWLDYRDVLIAPTSVKIPDWTRRVLPVDLNCEQVKESPSVNPGEPISREQELGLVQYYNWPTYWTGAGFYDPLFIPLPPFLPPNALSSARQEKTTSTLDEQHHIRSVDEVRGYRIEANDGAVGHVEDFLIDDVNWTIAYLVVDQRNWWPGKRVLVSPEWVYDVGWNDASVAVDLSRDEIRRSPAYDPRVVVTADYTDQLHTHFGQPRRSAEP